MSDLVLYIIILIAAAIGFSIAMYIRHEKKSGDPLICPLGANCDAVIHSSYSKFFGLPLEYMGILYYTFIFLSYFAFILFPSLIIPELVLLTVFASTAGFLFSIYLSFIQGFVLRQWCTWCLTSAVSSIVIFTMSILISKFAFIPVLENYKEIITAFHLIGFALGVGGATIADLLFFKFLKDFKISGKEASVLRTVSQVIWFGLALLVMTGLGLYIPETLELAGASWFLAKMTILLVIIINGAYLNLYIMPKLVNISFGESHNHELGELASIRRGAFSLGAISFVSWYFVFFLGMMRVVQWSLFQILGVYIILVFLAVLVSYMIGGLINKKIKEI